MEIFMPSEIARLVLGYLKEESCLETMKCFLSECIHLAEYNRMLGLGREFPTDVGELSLKKLINEFGRMRQSPSSNNSRSNVLHNTDPFKTPSVNTISTSSCTTPTIVNPLSELVEIAGNMEKQLKALVVATPSIGQHLAPHLLAFSGRHSAGHQTRRTKQKMLDQKDSNQNMIKNADKPSNKKDVVVNGNNCSDDVTNNVKRTVRNERVTVVRTRQNVIEDYVAINPVQASDRVEEYEDNQTSADGNNNKAQNNLGGSVFPESPISSLGIQIAPQKLPISTSNPVEMTQVNTEAPVDDIDLPRPLSSVPLVINSETEEQRPLHEFLQNVPRSQADVQHSPDADLQMDHEPPEEQTNMAEYFAKFNSTLLPSEIEETTSDGIGPPLHNSTSLVSLEEHNSAPMNFDHDGSMVIHSSSPDIFRSQDFQGITIPPSTLVEEFSFPSMRFNSLESAPIVRFQASAALPNDGALQICQSQIQTSNSSSDRSLKFRKLSQRFIAEHQREQIVSQSLKENVLECVPRKPTNNTNNGISSSSEKRLSEANPDKDDFSESSRFSFRHIAEIVNFAEDSRTLDAPFTAPEPEISSQVVSSSRLIGSPEYSNSPLSCPSSTPLKRPRDETQQPPPAKRKKKDLKSMDIETFLAKIHQR